MHQVVVPPMIEDAGGVQDDEGRCRGAHPASSRTLEPDRRSAGFERRLIELKGLWSTDQSIV